MPIPISGLPAQVVPGDNDPLAIVDSAGAITKRITRANLLKGAPLPAGTVTTVGVTDNAITASKINYSTVPAFRAFLSANQGGANNTVINLNSESYDNLNTFNTTNYRFVAPYAGIYHFSWNLHSSAGTDVLSGITVNGTIAARGSWIKGSTFVASSGSTDLSLAANDYVQLYCVNLSGTATVDGGTVFTYMSGHLVAKV